MTDAEDNNDFDEREKMSILTTTTTHCKSFRTNYRSTSVFDVDFEFSFDAN
jgi:hypothetical protein